MSIRYTCTCGATIRLPHTAAGRKAKCKSCGSVFKVPRQPANDDMPIPLVKSRPVQAPPAPDAAPATAPPGAWLDELARQEPRAAGESDPQLLDITETEYVSSKGRPPSPRAELEDTQAYAPDEGPWVLAPERSFLGDLAESFLLFLDPGNFIAFVFLIIVKLIFNSIPLFGWYGLLVLVGVNGYIYAFFIALVRETATGEDQFPTVWFTDYWDDLVVPLIQYLGTKLFVMWPCVALAGWAWWQTWDIDWDIFNLTTIWQGQGLAQATAIACLIGNLLWPAVVLTVAIGGTFVGLWPHVVIRTAIAAPLGYLTICAAIMAADALSSLPNDPRFIAAIGMGSRLSGFSLRIISTVLGMYSSLLAMRVIGLYYRHFKRRLPWVAEQAGRIYNARPGTQAYLERSHAMSDRMQLSRRAILTGAAGAAGVLAAAPLTFGDDAPEPKAKGRINQSVCAWCYGNMSLDDLCKNAARIGYKSVELVGQQDWPTVKKHGLTMAMFSNVSIGKGYNRKEHFAELNDAVTKSIDLAAEAGFPNVICMSGNRAGQDPEVGIKNCIEGVKQVVGHAEKKGVNVCMEFLNSKVDHKDYDFDHMAYGVAVVKGVSSERFGILYDIYHAQIMEGDIIRTIRDNHQYIKHYHTGGNPGRNEIDDTQELNYAAIMRAIAKTGYKGYVGQEFIPKGDAVKGLENAFRICDV